MILSAIIEEMDNLSRDSLTEALLRSDQTVTDLNVQTPYKRKLWQTLDQYLQHFLLNPNRQWIVMPGLRGVGKTTLLTQIYNHPALEDPKVRKFYFSFENLAFSGASVNDFVEAIKYLRRTYQEQPFFIFLDEVHSDSQWSLGCKIIFDQVPKVFMVCTGSSALSLRLNPDSARRADILKVHPLSLEESIAINQVSSNTPESVTPNPNLDRRLQEALFDSDNALKVYERLAACEDAVQSYYSELALRQSEQVDENSFAAQAIDFYINDYGSLPSLNYQIKNQMRMNLQMPETAAYNFSESDEKFKQRLLQTINQMFIQDSIKLLANGGEPGLGFQLQAATINLLPKLTAILANSERVSLIKIGKQLGETHQKTLRMMLKVLIASDMIIEVAPLGTSLAKSSKTPKYLFGTPALRQALVPLDLKRAGADNNLAQMLRGRLLEDGVIMQLKRIFDEPLRRQIIEYDSKSGGADFIIVDQSFTRKNIVIEVGYSKNSARQVKQTMKKKGLYGLVITNIAEPRLEAGKDVVYVPLKYFFLS